MKYQILMFVAGQYLLVNLGPTLVSMGINTAISSGWNLLWTKKDDPTFNTVLILDKDGDYTIVDSKTTDSYKSKQMIII